MNLVRCIRRVWLLLLALVSAILSIIGAFRPWVAVAAGGFSAIIAVLQYIGRGSYVHHFKESDWIKGAKDYELYIGAGHGKGSSPVVASYMPTGDGTVEMVETDVRNRADGSVVLGAGSPFDGEVRIN